MICLLALFISWTWVVNNVRGSEVVIDLRGNVLLHKLCPP